MTAYASPFGPGFGTSGNPQDFGSLYYWNYVPEAGYSHFGDRFGGSGTDPFAHFYQGSYNRKYNQYLGAAASDPTMGFYDYLTRSGWNPRDEFNLQSADQRGDFSSRLLTPRARWVLGG